ncbi:hypothetical protein DFQ27_005541 [Actinomortierella ambigua]|uniref:Alcohol dehydrogenase-like C-terminal domain-containing protein n=1 Tax=Actinomortierella ambigua TaxID=1343610 RepID=A0A9P6Q214_9FUNG|nr:hypothetical protein DFQ27_005541 [Actinomortierella ambigua]
MEKALDGIFALKAALNNLHQGHPELPAPLLCAGVTTSAPLARYSAKPTKRVGVLGLGGLGHLGVQIARAFDCKEVVVVSTSDSKHAKAEMLNATRFINSRSPEQMAANAGTIDLLLVISSCRWSPNNGTCVLLALPEKPVSFVPVSLISRHIQLTGSPIGGHQITEETLHFAAKHNVRPWTEKMPMSVLPSST